MGMGASATSVSQGLMCSTKIQAPTVRKMVLALYMRRRAQQVAHRLQVVGHARHDVAGAVVLIEARVLLFQVNEEVVAQVELDLARDANQNPSLRVEKNALHQRDQNQQPSEDQNPVAGDSVAESIDGLFKHLGKKHPHRVG